MIAKLSNSITPVISVILTAHNEGRLVHHTLKSVMQAKRFAESKGLGVEVVAVLDKPSSATLDYFQNYWQDELVLETVSVADPGLARNHGVSVSRGKWIALLDADDLFGEAWLVKAYNETEEHGEQAVYHPEYCVNFGKEKFVLLGSSTADEDFNPDCLIQYNYWNSIHFLTSRKVLAETPFEATETGSGFGYEDWHWHCEVVAKGVPVHIVKEGIVFYRRKTDNSRFLHHTGSNVIIHPTALFAYPQTEDEYNRFLDLNRSRDS